MRVYHTCWWCDSCERHHCDIPVGECPHEDELQQDDE